MTPKARMPGTKTVVFLMSVPGRRPSVDGAVQHQGRGARHCDRTRPQRFHRSAPRSAFDRSGVPLLKRLSNGDSVFRSEGGGWQSLGVKQVDYRRVGPPIADIFRVGDAWIADL